MATFACKHLRPQAFAHDIISEIQHSAFPATNALIICIISKPFMRSRRRATRCSSISKKPLTRCTIEHSRPSLNGQSFPTSTISLIKQLYSFPEDRPIINGRTPHAYLQTRASDKDAPSPPYSSFFISTPSSTIFLPLCPPPPRANARTSHHAYIDDILIKSEDVIYIQNSLNYFDGPSRDWGPDMNVSKTEVHANGTAPQKEFLTPRGSEFVTYNKKTGRPHTCYKYLGPYLFTCHQAGGLFHMLKAEIQSYFARLIPLPLTLSEKVCLTNSQLVPVLPYCLITHSLSPNQLEKLQSLIWAGVASGSITRLVSPKDRFAARPKGGLGMKFLPQGVHVATVNYGLRALSGLAPKSVGPLYVQSLLSSNQRASDPVLNSFMDSIHTLGMSFHGIGPWRPTAIRDLTPGTQLTVRFKSGQATGRVTKATSKWANVSFHDAVYSVDTHTSYTMHMPCHAVMDYSPPSHFQLVPDFLRPQETIPEPPAPPHNTHALGISQHGHLFALQAQHYLGKKSPDKWGCLDAAEALSRPPPPGLQQVWLYSDGSSGESGHAAAVTAFLPDGTTRFLCLSSPHPSSLGSEFWWAVAAIHWIHRELSQYEVCLLIDNKQVVSTLQKCGVYRPSPFQDDTWTVAVHSALLLITNPLHIMWIKGHANFIDNEICDDFSKWAAHSLIVTPDLLPPPPWFSGGTPPACPPQI